MSDAVKSRNETNQLSCTICLGNLAAVGGSVAHPEICDHQFCYLCIAEWMKRRSECPLCKRQAKALIVTDQKGKTRKVPIKTRTEAQYALEIARTEEQDEEAEHDITVMYANCQVCHRSDNDHLLMLCDGIVGHNSDGTPVYCNSGCHCYCLPEKLSTVPEGNWYCPFCSDFRATQQSVYNSRYVASDRLSRRFLRSQRTVADSDSFDYPDLPGPSGLRRVRQDEECDIFIDNSVTESDKTSTDSESVACFSEVEDSVLMEERANWSEQDELVLAERSDETHSIQILTKVDRKRRLKSKRKAKKSKAKQKRRKKCTRRKKGRSKRQKRRATRKKLDISLDQIRLAEAIGVDPFTGEVNARTRSRRRGRPSAVRRGPLSTPALLIDRLDDLAIPYDEPEPEPAKREDTSGMKSNNDLMNAIMCEQEKTFAPSKYQRIQRDGTIKDTEEMAAFRIKNLKKGNSDRKPTSSNALHDTNKLMHPPDPSETESKEKRKKRITRWGTPTTSEQLANATCTASIPLPSGPPVTQSTVSLENIPVPLPVNQHSFTQMALPQKPSALNTTPSTSFAMNASTASLPSFAVGGASIGGQAHLSLSAFAAGSGLNQQLGIGLNQQPLAGLGQPTQLTQIGQNSLVQMQPTPLIPNLFLPPLNISTMNNLLTAGFLASNNHITQPTMTQSLNQPITQPSTVPTAPFILNPVQFASSGQNLNQHLANLATFQRSAYPLNLSSQQASRPLEGVPPPPPVVKVPQADGVSNIAACEPLAEKIRKLVEACNVRPLCTSSAEENVADVPSSSQETHDADKPAATVVKGSTESGRKSASADDEETGEINLKPIKQHKNGEMFEEARRMLSSSLKKSYRKKQITKDEYKKIMKKGVALLSQRTKLDQRKVDEYAAKYVECIAHRRKKRH